jgi:NAD(P)-dependent dehydrogenase (short-subunit alcohol dehydrogenase family)
MCAEALRAAGASVIVTTRKADAKSDAIVVDLAAPEGVDELAAALADRTDALDILVNNAGVTWGAPFDEYPAHAWQRVLNLDVAVPFRLVQSTLGLLRAAATEERPARVVNIGSVDGFAVGAFDNYAYAAAKAAVHQLTRVLALRLGGDNVTVNAIAPGPIRTDMTTGILEQAESTILEGAAIKRLCGPADLAGALVYLTSDAGSLVTGAVVPVDGGLSVATWGGR